MRKQRARRVCGGALHGCPTQHHADRVIDVPSARELSDRLAHELDRGWAPSAVCTLLRCVDLLLATARDAHAQCAACMLV